MTENVAILGVGMTRIEGSKTDQKLDDVVFEATSRALQDASVTRDDIDSVVISACDELDGRCISSMVLATPAGSYLKDEIKVTDDGSYGVILGAMRILSGLFDLSLVVSQQIFSTLPGKKLVPHFRGRCYGSNECQVGSILSQGIWFEPYYL